MLDCTTDKYDEIYAPWLRNAGTLLDLARWKPGETLLDLCGGTGIVCREAIFRGGDPDEMRILDLNPRCLDRRVGYVQGAAEEVLPRWGWDQFDVVVCRQAVGYLDMEVVIPGVHRVLKPRGRFAFNTFARPEWPYRVKVYHYAGHHHLEAALRFGERLLHLQANRAGWDVTRFRCHDGAELSRMLDEAGFNVSIHPDGRSSRWVCTKGG